MFQGPRRWRRLRSFRWRRQQWRWKRKAEKEIERNPSRSHMHQNWAAQAEGQVRDSVGSPQISLLYFNFWFNCGLDHSIWQNFSIFSVITIIRPLHLLNLEYPCNDDKLCFLGNSGTYLDKTVLTAGTSHRQTNVGVKKATQNLMTKTERMNSSTGPGMITSFAFMVVSLLLKLQPC